MAAALHWMDWAIIALYLALMMALGAFIATRIRGFKDYFLAGGALTTPLLICTLVSTYFGLDVTFGTSEAAYYDGLAAWFFYSLPYYITIAIAALVIAPRLRRRMERAGGAGGAEMMTLSDVLQDAYGTPTRFVGAIACFVYSAPILQMAGLTTLLLVVGFDPLTGVLVAIAICAAYTILGGLWADAVSDTIQFILMCGTIALVIPLALGRVGGFAALDALPPAHMEPLGGKSMWLLAAWMTGSLTVLAEPSFYNRVFAARDTKSIRNALLLGIGLWAAYDWGVVIVGMIARAAADGAIPGVPGLNADMEGREALLRVSIEVLPTGLRGLLLGGILASAMSTVDSYSLLASGNLTYDIYRPLHRRIIGRPLSDAALLALTRAGVFVVMGAAAWISMAFERIREGWIFMTSVLVSVVLVPVLAAVFGRPRPGAGLWAAATGMIGLIAFYVLILTQGQLDPDEETYVWRIGALEIWQECAALFALPVSALGFLIGQAMGRGRGQEER